MKEYAILNFVYKENHRTAIRLQRAKFQNEWVIFYDRVDAYFTIRHGNDPKKLISLIGDEPSLS